MKFKAGDQLVVLADPNPRCLHPTEDRLLAIGDIITAFGYQYGHYVIYTIDRGRHFNGIIAWQSSSTDSIEYCLEPPGTKWFNRTDDRNLALANVQPKTTICTCDIMILMQKGCVCGAINEG